MVGWFRFSPRVSVRRSFFVPLFDLGNIMLPSALELTAEVWAKRQEM